MDVQSPIGNFRALVKKSGVYSVGERLVEVTHSLIEDVKLFFVI